MAIVNDSLRAIIVIPKIILLHIFAACPEPKSPACTTFLPISFKIGNAKLKLSSFPPTIKVKVPLSAPTTPPDTGASIICILF